MMRQGADALADYGVDALASESLGRLRSQRLAALTFDAEVPPFFGRTDRDDASDGRGDAARVASERGVAGRSAAREGRTDSGDIARANTEELHIGRRHIRDAQLNPVVIDWRAPIARPFYRATPAARMGVTLRRRFGFRDGALSSYEDEHLDLGERLGLDSQLLREEIERPRVGPMRDIVSTIQPDQDDLVRADLDTSLCIQGSPGTGKTAVGLHRAAYLLYSYPQRLRRTGVLVVGPNDVFLHYIAQVLPALGEGGIAQATVEDLVGVERSTQVGGTDSPAAAVLKGDARMAGVLARAVQSHIRKPVDDVVVVLSTTGSGVAATKDAAAQPAAGRRYRIGAHSVRRYVDDARREFLAGELRWNAARDRLRRQIAEDVRRQREAVGGAPTDAETRKLANSAAVKQAVEAVWPTLSAPALLTRLYTDEGFRARATGAFSPDEAGLLAWQLPPRTAKAPRWTAADHVLLDELAGLLDGVDSFVHVVVDEAQDLSAMQCRAVARRSVRGSITVLGDLAQATTPWAPGSWTATLGHLGKPAAEVRALTVGYRVPEEVLTVANRLLRHIAPELLPASSVRRGEHEIDYRGRSELVAAVANALSYDGSVGVLVPAAQLVAIRADLAGTDERVTVVAADQAKGLEFDSVIVVEPAAIVDTEDDRRNGLRRLYVVLTRAVSRLYVLHDMPLPVELA